MTLPRPHFPLAAAKSLSERLFAARLDLVRALEEKHGEAGGLAEEGDLAGAGREVAGERLEERGLAAAVGAEDRPVFAGTHLPVDAA